jgi:AcrR family transcriptional regulator
LSQMNDSNIKSDKKLKDSSTENKILDAARKIFTQRGYEGTKLRDIAAEADINLSLVNYYFRSKERLFEQIMTENINSLFVKIFPVLNDEETSLENKFSFIAEHYISILLENPDLPRFIVSEMLSGSNKIPAIASKREQILNSAFLKQLFSLVEKSKKPVHPVNILMNLLAMIIFPFQLQNVISLIGIPREEFVKIMEERKKMIPVWLDAIIAS